MDNSNNLLPGTAGAGVGVHFGNASGSSAASSTHSTGAPLSQLLAQQLYAAHYSGGPAPILPLSTSPSADLPTMASSAPVPCSASTAAASILLVDGANVSSSSVAARTTNYASTNTATSKTRESHSTDDVRDGEPSTFASRPALPTFPVTGMADAPATLVLAAGRSPLDHFTATSTAAFIPYALSNGESARVSGSATPNLMNSAGLGTSPSSSNLPSNADDGAPSVHTFSLIGAVDGEDGEEMMADADEEDEAAALNNRLNSRQSSTTTFVGKFSLAGPNVGVAGSKAAAAAAAAAAGASMPNSGSTPRLVSTPRSLFASVPNPAISRAGSLSGNRSALEMSPPSCTLLPQAASASATAALAARPPPSLVLGGSPPSAPGLPASALSSWPFSTARGTTPVNTSSTPPPARTHLHSPAHGAGLSGDTVGVVYGTTALAVAPPVLVSTASPLSTPSTGTSPGNSPRPSPLTLTQKQHQQQALARKQALAQQQQALAAQQQQQPQQPPPPPPPPQQQPVPQQPLLQRHFSSPHNQYTSSSSSDSVRSGRAHEVPSDAPAATDPSSCARTPPMVLDTPPVSSQGLDEAMATVSPPPPPPASVSAVQEPDDARLMQLLDSLAGTPLTLSAPTSVSETSTSSHNNSHNNKAPAATGEASTPLDKTAEGPAPGHFLSVHALHNLADSPVTGPCAVSAPAPGTGVSGMNTASMGPTSAAASEQSSRSSSAPRPPPRSPRPPPHMLPTPVWHPSSGRSRSVVEVYSPDFKYLLSIPAHQIVHHPPQSLGVSRLVLCRNYDATPGGVRSCTKGEGCKFVHADTTGASRCSIHVNYAYRALEACDNARLPAGDVLDVLAPNERPPCEPIPSDHVLLTQGSQGWYNAQHPPHRPQQPPSAPWHGGVGPSSERANSPVSDSGATPAGPAPGPPSHCAHYYFNRICNRGERCHFIHAIHIDPSVTKAFKRAPAPTTVAPIVKRPQTSPHGPPRTSPANGSNATTPHSSRAHRRASAEAYAPLQPPPPPPPPLTAQPSPSSGLFTPSAASSARGVATFACAPCVTGNAAAGGAAGGGRLTPARHSPVTGTVGMLPYAMAPPPPPPPPAGGQTFVYYDALTGAAMYAGPPSTHNMVQVNRVSTPTSTTSTSPTCASASPVGAPNFASALIGVNPGTMASNMGTGFFPGPPSMPSPTSATSPNSYFLMIPGGSGGTGNGGGGAVAAAGPVASAAPSCCSPFSATALELSPMQTGGNSPSMNSSIASPLDWSFYGELETAPAVWPTTPTK